MRILAATLSLIVMSRGTEASNPAEMTYARMCEVSAAAPLDGEHFAVASDETNVIRIYRKGDPNPVGELPGVETFTTFDKSDLEGAARVRDRVYWISSHSHNKDGKDRPKRKLFFATDVRTGAKVPTLELVGKPRADLRDAIAQAAGASPAALNIEGLAATEDGKLLIGLRAPLYGSAAVVARLDNPDEVVMAGAAPRFGPSVRLDLGGRGIRSMERVGSGESQFLIVAGPVADGGGKFALYAWSGRPEDLKPRELTGLDLGTLFPEALVALPPSELLVMSDEGDHVRPDGSSCDDEKPASQPAFRVRSFALPK